MRGRSFKVAGPLAALAVLAALGGCTSADPTLGDEASKDAPEDVGGRSGDAPSEDPAVEDGQDPEVAVLEGTTLPDPMTPDEDGALDEDEEPPAPSTDGGATCAPTTTFVPATGATGSVCNAANVLHGRAGGAGLDYNGTTQKSGMLDGRSVTACIGADFSRALTEIVVRAAATGKACDTACTGTYCGTGHTASVFAGTAGAYKYVATLSLATTYADYKISVPSTVMATRVIVCRTAAGAGRDDVTVDAIRGVCP